jgi:cell wall-associated NlpC family hydrolase
MIIQKKGTIGSEVVWIKQMLEKDGCYKSENPDEFGILCELAVKEFQRKHNLTVDGLVGDCTREELKKFESQPSAQSSLRTEFVEFVKSQVGYAIYLWGGQGQIYGASDPRVKPLTIELIRKVETQSQYRNDAIKLFNSRIKNNKIPFRAFDCSGLVIFWLLIEKKLISRDYTAQGIYDSLCKPVNKDDLLPGDLGFRTGNDSCHVGVYVGDGKIVHSKGRAYGVVMEAINSSWNKWGRLNCIN